MNKRYIRKYFFSILGVLILVVTIVCIVRVANIYLDPDANHPSLHMHFLLQFKNDTTILCNTSWMRGARSLCICLVATKYRQYRFINYCEKVAPKNWDSSFHVLGKIHQNAPAK